MPQSVKRICAGCTPQERTKNYPEIRKLPGDMTDSLAWTHLAFVEPAAELWRFARN